MNSITIPFVDDSVRFGAIADRRVNRSIKASAVSLGGTKKAHLEAAELRGVALAAAVNVCEVRAVSKAVTSRTFGSRGVDEYLKDNDYWTGLGLGDLKKGMREAAFTAISQFA